MSRDLAKEYFTKQPGDDDVRWMTPARARQALDVVYDDLDVQDTAVGVNVKDYGAIGDGSTDDTFAIQSAIEAVTPGGRVLFPEGTYIISIPLVMYPQVALQGLHEPRYDPAATPTSPCALKASAGFVGAGMITYQAGAYGVTLRNLALIGPGEAHASGAHGVRLPDEADVTGELGWVLDKVTIAGFPGSGVYGHGWVLDILNCHIARCDWGILADSTNALLDTRITNSMIYFNRNGGLGMKGSTRSGQVTVVGSRFERSGNTYGDPASPIAFDAPGVRLGNCQDIQLLGVSTDANTGPGLWIEREDPAYYVYSIQVVGCAFTRDGGEDQVTPTHPGILLRHCSHIKIANSNVGYGQQDDGGGGGPVSPTYGLEIDSATSCDITDCRIETETFANSLNIGTANYGSVLRLAQHGQNTLPVVDDPSTITDPLTGTAVYSPILGKPQFWTGSSWRDAIGGDGVNPVRLGKSIDLSDTSGDYKSIRIFTDDYGTAEWILQATPTAQFQLDQYTGGTYSQSPIVVRDDGFVSVNQTAWTDLSASCTTAFQGANTVQIKRDGFMTHLSIIYGGGTATGTTVCAAGVIPAEYLPDWNVRYGIVAPWVESGSPTPVGWVRLETDGSVTMSATTSGAVHCQLSWLCPFAADWPGSI